MSEAKETLQPVNSLERYRIEKWTGEAELKKEEVHGLTALPYETLAIRRQLVAEVEQSAETGKKISVGFLDMDGLGAINERYGHEVGNRSIKALAERVKQLAVGFAQDNPNAQVFLFHLFEHRGDEMRLLILGEEDEEKLFEAINKMSVSFEENGQQVEVAGSCGAASNKEGLEADLAAIEKRANMRVFEIKAQKIRGYFATLKRAVNEEDFSQTVKIFFAYRKLSPDELDELLRLHKECVGKNFMRPGGTINKN